jgi:hypothetical protein
MRGVFNIYNVSETRQHFHRTEKEPIQLSPLEKVVAVPPREPHGIATMLLTLPLCFPLHYYQSSITIGWIISSALALREGRQQAWYNGRQCPASLATIIPRRREFFVDKTLVSNTGHRAKFLRRLYEGKSTSKLQMDIELKQKKKEY